MAVEIRLATRDDIPVLEELIPLSVRGLSGGYYTPAQIESAIIHIFGVDSQLIDDGTYFVAESNHQIVGCGGWSKRKTLFGGDQMKGDEDGLLDPQSEPARIRAFFVHPDWTRKGIGKRIISACENAARESGFNRLELAATLPGEPLYAAVGYHPIEKIDVPMPDGEFLAIIRMGKTIQLTEPQPSG
ncbi:MAG: GNAT family N-acetyltransferase [Acidobacteriota bacterium]